MLTHQNLWLPAGFSDSELLYTFSWISDFIVRDSQWNKTGFQNGDIFEEIPGSQVLISLNASWNDEQRENNWKQIYFPEGRDDLTLEVDGNLDESYTLMIAGGNYYNEIASVEIHEGEKDIFHSQNGEMILDFDDHKSWEYTIIMDDFRKPEVETVVLNNMQSTWYIQKYSIDWIEEGNSVSYALDTNDDGVFDMHSSLDSESDVWNISWYLTWNTNAKMAGWKMYLDINNNGTLEENEEPFVVTDKEWYYAFTDLKTGNYTLSIIPHTNWNFTQKSYDVFVNKGQNFQNLNFSAEKTNGKSKK